MDIRKLENTQKYGYYIYISYDGSKFAAFDELKDKNTVKGHISDVLKEYGITWAKGIQQAGRTDAKVSANENILYISSRYNSFDTDILKNDLNKKLSNCKINKIRKTIPDLVLPEIVSKRIYRYKFPMKLKLNGDNEIERLCEELSGVNDVSEFTDAKGKQLKQNVREVEIKFDNGTLLFEGESFMPKQVRIMSAYILSGQKKIYPAEYLSLEKVILNKDFENKIFVSKKDIIVENVKFIEKLENIYYFYVTKDKKGEIIGKKGKNIKRLKEKYGDIVVKEI